MASQGVWIRYGDECKLFFLKNGKLDLQRIASVWRLNLAEVCIADVAVNCDAEGLSIQGIDEIRGWASDAGAPMDGKRRDSALVLTSGRESLAGITAVELREALTSILAEVRNTKSDSERTRSASKITVPDFHELRKALNVVITHEDLDGNLLTPNVLDQFLGDDRFWNQLYERQQKERYIEKLKEWVPEGGIAWLDADGHTIKQRFVNGPFPVSGQNGQVAVLRGLDMAQGALLAVELKRKVLTRKALRQAEVEFYFWSVASLLPFVQLITDMQRGGIAIYCRSREPGRVEIVHLLLRDMKEVELFVQTALNDPPSNYSARYDEEATAAHPARKKFKPMGGEEEKTAGAGTSSSNLTAQRLLWTWGPQILAAENDIANLADLQCFECFE